MSEERQVTRRLIVMRHAKSDWPPYVADIDRPLGDRGRTDAAEAGRWLGRQDFSCDVALVSPALRTRQTWQLVSGQLAEPPAVNLTDAIYDAHFSELLQVVRAVAAKCQTVVLVGHNPGCAMLAEDLAGPSSDVASMDRLSFKYPTLGCAVLEFSGEWDRLEPDSAVLRDFAVPRG
jgi:phosphohistidine phosphatase